jgi:hypothetical protein
MDGELKHYGVLGQKWGVITKREGDLRSKAKNVVKTQSKLASKTGLDVDSAVWMSKSVGEKAFQTLQIAAFSATMNYALRVGMGKKTDIKQVALKAIKDAAVGVAIAEYGGRSSLKRYDTSGKRDMSKKQYKHLTPELAGAAAIYYGVKFAPLAGRLSKLGLQYAANKHAQNRARVDAWGQNILPKKTSEFHTVYDDGYMSILEKIKP